MAKCSICNSRKGKRKCKADGTFICSLCCGQSRDPGKCNGCSFFKDPSLSRNYRKIPFFSTHQMSTLMTLEDIANVIESTLCGFDLESEEPFTDKKASQLIELFFDKYYFNDADLKFSSLELRKQFHEMLQICEQDLPDTPSEQLIKVMAAIYRSIQRRTNGGREYLQFAQQYVGARVAHGTRIITQDNL